MIRRVLALVAGVALVGASCGGDDAEPTTFTPPGGSYSIEYPSEPEQVDLPLALPTGETVQADGWMVETSDYALISYEVDYSELLGADFDSFLASDDMGELLISIRDGSIGALDGNLTENEEVELDGMPGLKFGYDFEQSGTSGYGVSVVYTDGTMMYFAGGVGERDTADTSEEFVDSFEFIDGTASGATSDTEEDGDS